MKTFLLQAQGVTEQLGGGCGKGFSEEVVLEHHE